MRFRTTDDNLEISAAPDEVNPLPASVYKSLIPSHAHKLYVRVDVSQATPVHSAVIRVTDESTPGNFLRSFRVIVRGGTVVLVAARGTPLRKSGWRELAAPLQAQAGEQPERRGDLRFSATRESW